MKTAFSCRQGDLNEQLEQRFGRSPKFLIIDTETDEKKIIDNKLNMNSPQGAGIQTAKNLYDAGVEAVVSGHLGPNAFQTLKSAGISAYTASNMSVNEAYEAFKAGSLKKLDNPDVQGHY